jgi:hypothetical protein
VRHMTPSARARRREGHHLRELSHESEATHEGRVCGLPCAARPEAKAVDGPVHDMSRRQGEVHGLDGPRRVRELPPDRCARPREAGALVRDLSCNADRARVDEQGARELRDLPQDGSAWTERSDAGVRELPRAAGEDRAAWSPGVRDVSRHARRETQAVGDVCELSCESGAKSRQAGLRELPPCPRADGCRAASRVHDVSSPEQATRAPREQGPRGVRELPSLARASAARRPRSVHHEVSSSAGHPRADRATLRDLPSVRRR